MAPSIRTVWILVFAVFLEESQQEVFLSANNANTVFRRQKRANILHLEEIFPGNLERECLEERCSYEEAREALEHKEKTNRFWASYFGGRQCTTKPCLNQGVCQDSIRDYKCMCPEGYGGKNCEYGKNECHPQMTDGCQHFCTPGQEQYKCSCAHGYELGQNDKSCIPKDPYACGKLLVSVEKSKRRTICEHYSTRGEFPWQALLVNDENQGFCSGVILNQNYVLTAAWCMNAFSQVRVVVGKQRAQDDERGEQVHDIDRKEIHSRYSEQEHENDIALLKLRDPIQFSDYVLPICIPEKDFAEQVLIPQGLSKVSGWKLAEGKAQSSLLYFQLSFRIAEECEAIHNFTLTNRRLCTTTHPLVNCSLTNGSPLVTEYKGTWFLTGILSFLPEEQNCLEGMVFTKISRYITWVNQRMQYKKP